MFDFIRKKYVAIACRQMRQNIDTFLIDFCLWKIDLTSQWMLDVEKLTNRIAKQYMQNVTFTNSDREKRIGFVFPVFLCFHMNSTHLHCIQHTVLALVIIYNTNDIENVFCEMHVVLLNALWTRTVSFFDDDYISSHSVVMNSYNPVYVHSIHKTDKPNTLKTTAILNVS